MRTAALAAWLIVAAQAAPHPPAATAETFFDLLVKQDFAAAIAMSNANMLQAMPEAKLRQLWAAIAAQAGPLTSRADGTATPAGNGHAVVIRATFAAMQIDFTIGIVGGKVSGLFMRPVPPPSAPPAYADPSAFTEREVTVGSGEWALPGTLSMPSGAGPFPAVVLVHGSGPNDRDETVGPNRPFRDLAHGLASRGIAVLRYDKRSRVHGPKMASIERPTVQHEVIDDAALAVRLLASTPSIAPDRIFVAGHSLGGMLVPRIAAAAPAARGFIVLAGAARPLEQAIVDQTQYLAGLDGTITPEEQGRIESVKRDFDAVRALTDADADADADAETRRLVAGVPVTYWLDLRGYDPPEAARAVSRPMLILQGERDYQVTMQEFARWQAALDGRADVTFTSYAALNHLFMPGTGPGNPVEYNVPRHVDEQVVLDIAGWILKF